MAGKLSGSAIQSGTITSTQLSTELGPVSSELQLVGSGVSLNVSNNAVFSGNVGIGTTSPTTKLDVTGNIAFSGTMTSSSATANGVTYFNSSKVLTSGSGLAFNGAQLGLTNAAGAAILKLDANTVPEIDFYINGSIKSYIYAPSTSLQFNTVGTNPILFMPNESERMRVDSNGNVGIGTTSPAAKFHIHGDIRVGSSNSGWQRVSARYVGTLLLYKYVKDITGGGVNSVTRDVCKFRQNYGWSNYYFVMRTYALSYNGTNFRESSVNLFGDGTNIVGGAYSPWWRYTQAPSSSFLLHNYTGTGPVGSVDNGYYEVTAKVDVSPYSGGFVEIETSMITGTASSGLYILELL